MKPTAWCSSLLHIWSCHRILPLDTSTKSFLPLRQLQWWKSRTKNVFNAVLFQTRLKVYLKDHVRMELKWVLYLITITWMQKAYLPLFSLPWRLEHAATDTPGSSWVKDRHRNIRKWRTIVIPCWISNILTTQWMQTTRLLAQVQHENIVFRKLAVHVSRSLSLKTAFITFCS